MAIDRGFHAKLMKGLKVTRVESVSVNKLLEWRLNGSSVSPPGKEVKILLDKSKTDKIEWKIHYFQVS